VFKQLLFVHWKGVKIGLLPFVLAAFGLPLMAVQGITPNPEMGASSTIQGAQMLYNLQVWVPFFPLLATLTGVTVALTAWNWDHRGEHVYPLSLPVARWQYVLMKMGAGAALLLIPFGAVWFGNLLATASLEIPEGLRAYPTAVAVRFLLTSLVMYALLFAMGAGTMRTAVWIIVGFLVVTVAGGALADFLTEAFFPNFGSFNLMEWVVQKSLEWPGPFEVVTGSWMLIDV